MRKEREKKGKKLYLDENEIEEKIGNFFK